jgi:hypothetical protein
MKTYAALVVAVLASACTTSIVQPTPLTPAAGGAYASARTVEPIQVPASATPMLLALRPVDDPLALVSAGTIRIPIAGVYTVEAKVTWSPDGVDHPVESREGIYTSAGRRVAVVTRNGELLRSDSIPAVSNAPTINAMTFDARFAAGDVLGLYGLHDSAGMVMTGADGGDSLSVRWVRP